MSLKAGKDVRLATYCPFPFFSNFLVQNLLRGIVVRLLIKYQHNIGAWRSLVARYIWDVEAAGSNPVAPTRRNLTFFENFDIIFIQEKAQTATHLSICFGNRKRYITCLEYIAMVVQRQHAGLISRRRGSNPTLASMSAVDIKQRSGLIHGFTLSTTTHSNNRIIYANIGGKLRTRNGGATRRLPLWLKVSYEGIGYEVCGYAAKDHSNLNEGEGKEICYLSGIG